MKRLMIMAGGTGGHIYPALAIARRLEQDGIVVTWLGTREGLEARVIPEQGIDIEWIEIKGVRGTGLLRWLKMPLQLFRAVVQAMAILGRTRPDALLSMGGFVAGPGGIAGRLKRIPLVIHEANAIAGLTNKALALVATRVMSAFEQTKGLGKNAVVVGNPVRQEIIDLHGPVSSLAQTTRPLRLLVVGGSQGAASFNRVLPETMRLMEAEDRPEIRHQTGRDNAETVAYDYESQGIHADVCEYIEDMAQSYAWADLVICRGGAMTIAEITTACLPAIIVPYPHSAGDHQEVNARYLEKHNAARVVLHDSLNPRSLATQLTGFSNDRSLLDEMSANSGSLAKIDATEQAAAVCAQVLYA